MDLTSFWVVGGAGLVLGGIVGAVAQITNFCSVGAVADIVLAGDWRRARSWLMALAVALLGTQVLSALGIADLSSTPYGLPATRWAWVAASSIAFGYGMALAGGCVQRALVRAGAGSIKSLVTLLIIAVAAGITVVMIPNPSEAGVTLPTRFAFALAGPVAIILVAFCLKDRWFRQSPGHLWGGVAIGAVVAIAWVFSAGHEFNLGLNLLLDLGVTAIAAPSGFSDVIPLFGLCAIAGIAVGSGAVAAARGDLSFDRFVDGADVERHIVGGLLMGIGGAMAYGCTFGQGLTGFTTLSASPVIAVLGMIGGCVWGIRALEAGTPWGGLRLVFRPR